MENENNNIQGVMDSSAINLDSVDSTPVISDASVVEPPSVPTMDANVVPPVVENQNVAPVVEPSVAPVSDAPVMGTPVIPEVGSPNIAPTPEVTAEPVVGIPEVETPKITPTPEVSPVVEMPVNTPDMSMNSNIQTPDSNVVTDQVVNSVNAVPDMNVNNQTPEANVVPSIETTPNSVPDMSVNQVPMDNALGQTPEVTATPDITPTPDAGITLNNGVDNGVPGYTATPNNLQGTMPGQPLNMEQPINTGSMAPETGNNGKKSNKKLFIIIGAIVLVIILVIVGLFVYVKLSFTAEKFLESSSEDIISYVSNMFSSTSSMDLTVEDIISSGTISMTSNDSSLSDLNNLSINYTSEISLDSDYIYLDLDLLESKSSVLSGKFYLNKDTLYLDSSDIYNYPLKYNLGENYFDYIDTTSSSNLDLNAIITKGITYLEDALENADISTKLKGTTVEYSYSINDSNVDTINNRFMELLESDSDFASILEYLDTSEELIPKMDLTITYNIISREIEGFVLTTEEGETVGEATSDTQFKITGEDSYMLIDYTDTSITIGLYEDNSATSIISIEKNDTITKITMTSDDVTITMSIDYEKTSDTEFKMDISLSIDSEGTNYTINVTSNNEYGKNLVDVENISYAQDIETLTEEQYSYLYLRLMAKLSAINFSEVTEEYTVF